MKDGFYEIVQHEGHATAAHAAAREITNDWATQAPIIDGFVKSSLCSDYTREVKLLERGKEVTWRVTLGAFIDVDGNRLRLATRMPTGKSKKDDLEYVLNDTRIIVNDNVEHVAATVSGGQIFNNDEELTAVLPQHPLGFTQMFDQICKSSQQVLEQNRNSNQERQQNRNRRIRRTIGWLAVAGALGATGAIGLPATVDRYYDHKETTRVQERIEAEATAVAKAEFLSEFDESYSRITDGTVVSLDEPTVIPASTEFALIGDVPNYDADSPTSQLENVRALAMPKLGETKVYEIAFPEGSEVLMAHSGDARMVVRVHIDRSSQTITVNNISLGEGLDPIDPVLGEVVLQLN